jgi:cell division protein ZapA (FtsZ GTPase activity inhibitor)
MAQSITIKIAGKSYALKADTPQKEEWIRRAAAKVDELISAYESKFPGKNMTDILSFVALNQSMSFISCKEQLDGVSKEASALKKDTDDYLVKIEEESSR